MTEHLLTPAQAADMLAMTKGALAQLRYLGSGPNYVKVSGRSVRYREQDVDAWIQANIHGGNRIGDHGTAESPDRNRQSDAISPELADPDPVSHPARDRRQPAVSARA